MAPEIEGGKSDPVDGELLGRGVEGGHVLGHAVVLEHVQQRRLARVVQAEEEQLARFFPEAEIA